MSRKKLLLPIALLMPMLLLLAITSVTAESPKQIPECAEDYTVQAGDWLSKIAEKTYGDLLAYPLIVDATNFAARSNAKYTAITNPGLIEVGQVLCLPNPEKGQAYLKLRAKLTAGSVVAPDVMHLILGNRSLEGITTTVVLSGGQFGEGQSFDIPASQEQKFNLAPGRYNITWQTPKGIISRDFEATAQVATIAWLVPEKAAVMAENQWAGGLAGAPRGQTELGWLHLPSVQSTETPYDIEGDNGLLVAGNRSFEGLYAKLTVSGGQFGDGDTIAVGPGQELLILVEPGNYQVAWEALDGVTIDPFTLQGNAAVALDDVTVTWVSPENRKAYIQSPGQSGQELQ